MQPRINSPIRVMRIIARMNVGGPAVQISGLMRGLDPQKFEHRLYTGYCDDDESDYLENIATDLTAFRIPGLGRHVRLKDDLIAIWLLVKEINEFKPHIIHTHTAKAGFLGRIASILSRQRSIRVHTFHGHLLHGYFGKLKTSLVVIAERILAFWTHALLAVGSKVRQDLIDVGIGDEIKFRVMLPGLEIKRLPNKSDSRKNLKLNLNSFQCAFIGRVTQIKRPDRFLDVVAEIKRRNLEIGFFIAGDGDLLNFCKNRIANEELPVRILGWQSNIECVLSAADLVIITSDNEGTPLSLIQAGMASVPVVTINVGSIPEIVIDGETGIITTNRVSDIADAIECLFNNPDLVNKMGESGKDFTSPRFGIERLVRDHDLLYSELLANRAKF